jgi:hypothetical protein
MDESTRKPRKLRPHPARRARRITAVASTAAFVAIGGSMARTVGQGADEAVTGTTTPTTTTTVATTATTAASDTSWAATPVTATSAMATTTTAAPATTTTSGS